jgi:hypothetical protein
MFRGVEYSGKVKACKLDIARGNQPLKGRVGFTHNV